MRFSEFNDGPEPFTATVRVVSKTSSITARTLIYAESATQGRAMLERLYGFGNVLGIAQQMTEESVKVLSAQERQVKSMSDQAKRLQQQAKQLKAQNRLDQALMQLRRVDQKTRNL